MKLRNLLSAAILGLAASAMAQNAPKYIFYFIGDGMGTGQVMATDTWLRQVEGRKQPILWTRFPAGSLATTYSASSPVTDSAAAGTALATGHKTRNNMLGMNADSVAVRSIADDLKELGYGVGLVTNVAADDATPGAFYAHVPSRNMAYQIDCQAAESKVDFLAGSRIRGAKADGKYTGIYEKFKDNGWTVTRGVENYDPKSQRVLLLCGSDTTQNNAGYAIDNPDEWNVLRDATAVAIDHLQRVSPDKFFLMVEGGNIDWAAHDDDAATIVREVLDYEETMRLAYDFYLHHPDETLIVVTADHETGGMTVGQRSVGYNCYPQLFDYQTISKAEFQNLTSALLKRQDTPTWEEMQKLLTDKIGLYGPVKVSENQDKRLKDAYERTFVTRNDYENDGLYHKFNEFTETAFTIANERSGIGFTTGNHSGNPVGVYAVGRGHELFGHQMDNTDIPAKIRRLIGK